MDIKDLEKFLKRGKYKDLPHRIEVLRIAGLSLQTEVNGRLSTTVWMNNLGSEFVVVMNHKAIKVNVRNIRTDRKYDKTNKRLGR